MNKKETYERSVSIAAGLGCCMDENHGEDDFTGFLEIRRELNQFLLNLNYSHRAEGIGQQVHFLFLALEHLDRVEKEIRVCGADEDLIRLGRIHNKIGSLKYLILNYIHHLTSGP